MKSISLSASANKEEKTSLNAKALAVYLYVFFVGSMYGNFASAELNQIILWVLGPVLLFFLIARQAFKLTKIPVEIKLFALLMPISFLGLFNVENTEGYFRYLKVLFSNTSLMIMVFVAINNTIDMKLILKTMFLATVSVVGLSIIVGDEAIAGDEYFRLTGIAGNANGLATYARVAIIMSLYYALSEKNWIWKAIAIASLALCLNVLIQTASRGNFANVLFSMVLFFSLKRLSGARLGVTLFVVYLLYLAFLTFGEDLLGDTFLYKRITRNESLEDAIESESRIDLYIRTFDLFLSQPFFGVGLNQVQQYLGKISHTDFLDIAAQTGIFGLIAYLSIYIKLFRRIINHWRDNIAKFSSFASSFFMTLFISEIIYGISNPNWFSQLNMVLLAISVTHFIILENNKSSSLHYDIGLKKPNQQYSY